MQRIKLHIVNYFNNCKKLRHILDYYCESDFLIADSRAAASIMGLESANDCPAATAGFLMPPVSIDLVISQVDAATTTERTEKARIARVRLCVVRDCVAGIAGVCG